MKNTILSEKDHMLIEKTLLAHGRIARVYVPLEEVGKMLGGWQKHFANDAPMNGAS